MAPMETTTIRVTKQTREDLKAVKEHPRETPEDVIRRLLAMAPRKRWGSQERQKAE